MPTPDAQLLADFLNHQSSEAFGELASRYVNMVHAAALRHVRDSHVADDVTQATFIVLASRAKSVSAPHLAGWLLMTTRYCAKAALRTRMRLGRHEHEAAMIKPKASPPADSALSEAEFAAGLGNALLRLGERDRTAVALRYLNDMPTRDVAAAMGLSVDATQKVISRALPKLKKHLTRSGIVLSSTAVLTGVLSHEAAHAAPAGLAVPVATASEQGLLIAKGAINMMYWNKIKLAAAAIAGIAACVTVGSLGMVMFLQALAATPNQIQAQTPPPAPAAASIPSAAPAQLAAPTTMNGVHSVSFKIIMTATVRGRPPVHSEGDTILADPGRRRDVSAIQLSGQPDGPVTILNEIARQRLILDPKTQTATLFEIPFGPNPPISGEALWWDLLKNAGLSKSAPIGEKVINGRPAQAFDCHLWTEQITVWVDKETRIPVLAESTADYGGVTGTLTYTDFVWGVPVEDSAFSMTPPSGYKLKMQPAIHPPWKEADLLEALNLVADLNGGTFPDDWTFSGVQPIISAWASTFPKDSRSPEFKQKSRQSAIILGGIEMVNDPMFGTDWHFAGKNVMLQAGQAPILWYRPTGSQTYHVISAGLDVREVAAHDLPRVPSLPSIAPATPEGRQ